MSDVIYRRTGNLRLARRTLLVVGLGGAFAFILPAILTTVAIRAVYLLGATFFFLELTNAVLWTLPLDIAGRHAGTAGGIMNTGFGVAGMISPVAFGVLIDRTGHYELPLFISAGLLHTDMSYLADPPKASALYALEVPPLGGDTSFCSMCAAWDELPAAAVHEGDVHPRGGIVHARHRKVVEVALLDAPAGGSDRAVSRQPHGHDRGALELRAHAIGIDDDAGVDHLLDARHREAAARVRDDLHEGAT